MLACVLLFAILLPIILFASTVENLFTKDELADMGVCLAYTRDGSQVA
jgi:hypothetical protein